MDEKAGEVRAEMNTVKRAWEKLGEERARFAGVAGEFGPGFALRGFLCRWGDRMTGGRTQRYPALMRAFCDREFGELARAFAERTAPETAPRCREGLPVWSLWWQGYDRAPAVVRAAVDSQRRWCAGAGYSHRLLTKDTYRRYVALDGRTEERLRRGTLPLAHASDLIRVKLLRQYGGLWCDATLFVSQPPEPELLAAPFVSIRKTGHDRRGMADGRWTTYFLGCDRGNVIAEFLDGALSRSVSRRGVFADYLLLDDLLDLAYRRIPAAREQLDRIPESNPHVNLLQAHGGRALGEEERARLDRTALHKLTYKKSWRTHTRDGRLTGWGYVSGAAERQKET